MRYIILVCICCCYAAISFAQSKPQTIAEIEDLLGKENYKQADQLVKQRIAYFLQNKNADTLSYYVIYLGKVTDKLAGNAKAREEMLSFLKQTKAVFPYHKVLIPLHIKVAHFVSTGGDHKWAYQLVDNLNKYFTHHQTAIKSDLPKIYFALGDFSIRMGNPAQASGHYKYSLALLKSIPNPDKEQLFIANNSMGIVKHFEPNPDSAAYYWKKALDMVPEMESTTFNRYCRSATVQNNLGNAYSSLGRQQDAIKMYENAILNHKKFIASPEPHPQKRQSEIYRLYATDNIAKIYLDLGDITRAYDLYYYSYEQKLQVFGKTNNEIDKALIFLSTAANHRHKYKIALEYGLEAKSRIKESGDTATSWDASANQQIAYAYNGLGNAAAAATHYEEAHRIHQKIAGHTYDQYYLDFTDVLAEFYTSNAFFDKAIHASKNGLAYLEKNKKEHTTYMLKKLYFLSKAYDKAKRYKEVSETSLKGLQLANNLLAQSKETLDSLYVEINKANLLLYQAKARYYLLAKKDTAEITLLLNGLEDATKIIEHRKTILNDETDINVLLSQYKELIEFKKQLNYELLKLTGNKKYIDAIINTHEGNIYSRIRSRMEKQKAIRFAQLPVAVQQQEEAIKKQMQLALKDNGTAHDKIATYMNAVAKWNAFQQTLKVQYPAYYSMRYGGTSISVKELSKHIPAGVTVVRYLFAGDQLFALVATSNKQAFVPLSVQNINEKIIALNAADAAMGTICTNAVSLYKQLWQPIEKEIQTKRVTVIPDGILHNLSFEILTPVITQNFAELSKKCLINKYALSYHYSLLALQAQTVSPKMKGNFVAFVPGFSENAKQQYLNAIKQDSLHLDRTYLSLLPLPFTQKLVSKIQNKFGGNIYAEVQSTPDMFRSQSANHRIIHIGTHAEANNDYPEYSRLIFSKDDSKATEENSVYLYDIYNCDLSSNLSVLTACESGKPGYQDGEGMISMAHAFSYAGSESMLTALWKIDEQTTSMITEYFYNNLKKGLSKDESLHMAKLSYLQNADGRMLAPQYWAGLVIMGDLSPIELVKPVSYWYYFMGGGALLLGGLVFFLKRNKAQ